MWGAPCGVAVPQQEGLNPHFSAGKVVLLGSTTVAALPGVPTPITARALWLSPSFLLEKGVVVLPSSPQEGAEGSAVLGPSALSPAGAQIKQRSPSVSSDGLSVPGTLVIQPFPHLQGELELSSVSKKCHWK